MKHATSRMLFSYWDSLRGERAAPERSDVEPGAIRHILADTFILGIDGEAGATFRLAGTRCSALFG
ncbi:MAG TPA: PAS domain-containing protein, partial [Enterovirga sp.]